MMKGTVMTKTALTARVPESAALSRPAVATDGADDEGYGDDQDGVDSSDCGELRSEEGSDRQGLEHSREHCGCRDEEERQVRRARLGDDQNPQEASNQGWEARDVRQGGIGEGEAGQDRRQGLRREGPQGRVLRTPVCSGRVPRRRTGRYVVKHWPYCPGRLASASMYSTAVPKKKKK